MALDRGTAADRLDEIAVDAAVARLGQAAAQGRPCPPIRDLIDTQDVRAAYAVQERLVTQRLLSTRASVVGHKVGLTAPAVQAQLGVDRPDFGVLLSDMAIPDGATVFEGRLLQPRVEAEVAFVLGDDLDSGQLAEGQIRAAVAYAVPAIEICDSRITDWNISFADTVADNASAGLFVLGTEPRSLEAFSPRAVTMSMTVNGQEVSTGNGAACLGDPLLALQWLARQLRSLDRPLRAGEIVLSGALGPMRAVSPGDRVRAVFSGMDGTGEVSVRFGHPGEDRSDEETA